MNTLCGSAALGVAGPRLKALLVAWASSASGAAGLSSHIFVGQLPVRLPLFAGPGIPGRLRRDGNASLEPAWLHEHAGPFEDMISPLTDDNVGIREGVRIPGVSINRTQSELSGVTMNGESDTEALVSAAVFSSVGFAVVLVLFSVLRRFNPAVYLRAGDPEVAAGLDPASKDCHAGFVAFVRRYVGWLREVMRTERQEEVREAGLDAWAFLEFHRLNSQILSIVGPIVLAVLCPLHYSASARTHPHGRDFISRLDADNLQDGSGLWWIHAVLVWFVVGVTTWRIRISHEEFLERRFRWLQELPAPQVKTVMVENIPEEYRSDTALKGYFERIFGEGSVERACVVRRTKELRKTVDKFELVKYNLLLSEQRWHQAGCPPANEGILDAYRSDLQRLSKKVTAERAKIEEICSGKSVPDRGLRKKYCAPSGFVTFSEVLTQRLATGEQYRKDVTEVVVWAAPDPSDVIYSDLVEESESTASREFLGWVWLIVLFVSWSPVVVFISSFTTLGTLEAYVPLVRDWCKKMPSFASFLEGVLATAALKLFMAFLPSILLGIIDSFFHLKAGAWAQVRLERWYFAFLTIFVLLVTILGRSIIITVAVLVQQPGAIINMLAQSLPGASHFYFNYFVLGWLTHAWEMVRIVNLCKFWLYRVFYSLPRETAKEYCEPEDPGSYGMGCRMAHAALMSAIVFVFCTCSPLIMVFAWIYFYSGRMAYGYLLVRAETRKPDLGGLFWIEAMGQVFFALAVFVFLMTGVLGAHAGLASHSFFRRFGPAILTVCCLLVLYVQWRKVNNLAWDSLPLQVLVEARVSPQGRRSGEYLQHECVCSVEPEESGDGQAQASAGDSS